MHLSNFDRLVWAATFLGHICILSVLITRRRAVLFPMYTASMIGKTVTTVILFYVLNHLSFATYRDCYWCLGVLDEVLQLLVFYELSRQVFCPTGVWARDVRETFITLVAAAALVSLLLSLLAEPKNPLLIQTVIARSNFFSALLMSGLFVIMTSMSEKAGLPMKTHVARIAEGWGAYSVFCVIKDIAVTYSGLSQQSVLYKELSHVRILFYLGCEIFWIVMLWRDAPAPRELSPAMRLQIFTLHKQIQDDLLRIRLWRRN